MYKEAFARLKIKFKAEVLPWPRCIKSVEKGDIDAIIDNGALKPFIFGKHPTGVYPLAIYVRKDFPQKNFSWDLMQGKTVGMVRGYDYTEKIKQFDGWKKQLALTDEQMLKMLNASRHDYVILDVFSADILAKKAQVNIKMLKPIIDSTHLYLVFNKDKSDVAKKYDETIGKMIQDGTLDKIYRKYLPYSYSEAIKMGKR